MIVSELSCTPCACSGQHADAADAADAASAARSSSSPQDGLHCFLLPALCGSCAGTQSLPRAPQDELFREGLRVHARLRHRVQACGLHVPKAQCALMGGINYTREPDSQLRSGC